MSRWAQTLDTLVRERGRELYGYAYVLTGARDAANDLLKDGLYQAFRRGPAPASVEEADERVRAALRTAAPAERVKAVATEPEIDAVREERESAIAALGSRDMTDVIIPTTRRTRQYRRNVRVGAVAGVVAAVGVIAVVANHLTAEDAVPEPSNSGVAAPAGTVFAGYLLSEASERSRTSQYSGMAGLICDIGDDNPHLTPETPAVVTTDCDTVWLASELALTLTTSNFEIDGEGQSITMDWSLETGAYPVLIDRAGIVGVLTTGSEGLAEDVSVSGTSLTATTTWTSDSTELGVLTADEDLVVVAARDVLHGTTTWTSTGDDLLARVLAGETPFWVGLEVRIGPAGDAGGKELLAIATDDTTYEVSDGAVVAGD